MLEKAKTENIQNWLEKINSYNSTPEFGTTRVLFTECEVAAREYVKNEMKSLGLVVREDSIGNIFGTLVGNKPELPPVWTGSHIDTVLNAGMFDGMAGVVGGMEALRLIKESGVKFDRNIEVVVYTSEEPTRFGLCCLGSRAMAGHLTLEDARILKDENGKTLESVLQELGYNLNNFDHIYVKKGQVFGAIELHIEQNNKLEKKGLPVGIVKTICAPTNYTVEVTGCQSHAGGTSMEDRRDAYAASCEIALVLEKLALKCNSEYNTATIGRVEVIPNAVNVIPGKVKFSIDIRDCEFETKMELVEKLKKEIKKIEEKREVQVNLINENNDIPMKCDPTIVEILRNSCEEKNIEYDIMISGAYHDSMFVGEFTPVAMIFVPSKNGISHSPDEWTDYKDIALGVDVLAKSLLELSNKDTL